MKFFLSVLFLLLLSACGVKGPPLPPVADDPAASERENKEIAVAPLLAPSPSPSPSPSGRANRKIRKQTQKSSQ